MDIKNQVLNSITIRKAIKLQFYQMGVFHIKMREDQFIKMQQQEIRHRVSMDGIIGIMRIKKRI